MFQSGRYRSICLSALQFRQAPAFFSRFALLSPLLYLTCYSRFRLSSTPPRFYMFFLPSTIIRDLRSVVTILSISPRVVRYSPPYRISRRPSPFEGMKPARTGQDGDPSFSSLLPMVAEGMFVNLALGKMASAAWTLSASSLPWTIAVTS